jgi:hypothetical protein
MSFQWLELRLGEERDRRRRQAEVSARLPRALDEIHGALSDCIHRYTAEFGEQTAGISRDSGIKVSIREEREGSWQDRARIDIRAVPTLPGFEIERDGASFRIEIGMLDGGKLFYKNGEEYLNMEDLTRRILDRAFFPKLRE